MSDEQRHPTDPGLIRWRVGDADEPGGSTTGTPDQPVDEQGPAVTPSATTVIPREHIVAARAAAARIPAPAAPPAPQQTQFAPQPYDDWQPSPPPVNAQPPQQNMWSAQSADQTLHDGRSGPPPQWATQSWPHQQWYPQPGQPMPGVAPVAPTAPPPMVPTLLRTFDANDHADDMQSPAPAEDDEVNSPDDYYTPDEVERRRQRRILLNRLRGEASERLTQREQERKSDAANDERNVLPYTDEELRQVGLTIANELTAELVDDAIKAGKNPITTAEQHGLVDDIFNQLFRLGNIQHLIDEDGIEDIFIKGPYTYVRNPKSGRMEPRPPAFDSDDETIEWLQFQAGKAPGGGRAFSQANPELRLNLPGGIRLSAMAYTSASPSIALRQHRLRNITLDTLVDLGVLPPLLARILEASVRGAMSIVLAGPMGSGKTTFIRALANALPLDTRIGTAETEFELMLDQIPGREPFVVANETITGGGERNQNTHELVGKTSLTDILYGYVRQQLDRIIVGEVAGPEIIAMYQAMQFCEGTLSTTHATSAKGAIDRLVTIALANGGLDRTYAERQAAHHIDLIVQLKSERVLHADGAMTLNRYVSEVAYIEQGENDRAALTCLYRGAEKFTTGTYGTFPGPMIDILANAGFPTAELPSNTLNYGGDG